MKRRDVTASMRVSRFSRALSRVRRMSAEAKRLKTSSEDSGNSQNCCQKPSSVQKRSQETRVWATYRSPVRVVSRYVALTTEPEDAFLEDKL